ncbi:virion protein (Cop-E6R) [Choristoneura biennis entomopoxvirus]|uniref:Virion protein (Cop-E6R) n=1 Tax=Choristoneura biennis entomopoxvirus TaxID=10288 RepID=A0A916KPR3_CBEPV|nr:virion protein (Cop-E6R) [Choristoneura biennis entomopoxvirus]CCU55781.1 virion protein (Cop-E6R) [Choristoneura biennis entomopoxvirus]
MDDDFDIITKPDIIYTPVLYDFINKYGLNNILKNKKIINNYKFYILFISMQDYNIYNIIGKEYKLFILSFIKYIQDTNVKKFIAEVIDLDNTNMYKNFSEYPILYLWKYIYKIQPSNINDYNDIASIFSIKYILNQDNEYRLYTYDYDSIVKLLIFAWYSKYDLGVYMLYKDSDDEINNEEILNFIDNDYSIYHYSSQSDKDYPLFNSSQDTIDSFRSLPYDIINIDVDPGYVWKNPDSMNKLTPSVIATDVYEKYFSLLYNSISNGIVTNNIISWTYLFGYGRVDPILLNKLFSITMKIPFQLSGIIADLYNYKSFKAIDNIKDSLNENNSYNYFQGQSNINIDDAFTGLSNDILNIIAEKNFEPKGYFINFDIDINKINFNKNFFNTLLHINPVSSNMDDIKNKIKNTYNHYYTKYYVNIYNTVNYINSNNNKFEAIIDYNFTVLSEINETNLNNFNLPILKKEILNILYNKYYFIPDCNNINLSKQYNDFIFKKSHLTNIYNCLINSDVENHVLELMHKNTYLNIIFS